MPLDPLAQPTARASQLKSGPACLSPPIQNRCQNCIPRGSQPSPRAHHGPDIKLSPSHIPFIWSLRLQEVTTVGHPRFIDEGTEAQRDQIIRPRYRAGKAVAPGFEIASVNPKSRLAMIPLYSLSPPKLIGTPHCLWEANSLASAPFPNRCEAPFLLCPPLHVHSFPEQPRPAWVPVPWALVSAIATCPIPSLSTPHRSLKPLCPFGMPPPTTLGKQIITIAKVLA